VLGPVVSQGQERTQQLTLGMVTKDLEVQGTVATQTNQKSSEGERIVVERHGMDAPAIAEDPKRSKPMGNSIHKDTLVSCTSLLNNVEAPNELQATSSSSS
jgi:hypothetical protein